MKKAKKASLTTQYVLIVGALLLITNILLASVLMHQSTTAVRGLIRKNMLDMSNTAAGLLDGDALGAMTAEDVGGEVFNDVLAKLSVFQDNNDIEYIYAVRQVGEDEFAFTVDPDPVNPGEFGEPVLTTDALRLAGQGTATVDNEPAQDEWGNFYSAYSPVFDSNGKVAGIVGVDFDSEWYNRQVRENTLYIGLLSLLFVLAGGAVVLMISRKLQQRFRSLSKDLGVLSSEMDELMELISVRSDRSEEETKKLGAAKGSDQRVSDELEELGEKIQSMQEEMQRYLAYVRAQAYTDALTQVGNTTGYMELRAKLEEEISAQTAAFGLAIFDINLLKLVNDRYGHAAGDAIIRGTAEAISEVFGTEQTYRIGGDEFAAVIRDITEEEMVRGLEQVQGLIQDFNRLREWQGSLSVSQGYSIYCEGQDDSYQEVFVRADESMYQQKEEFHRSLETPYVRYCAGDGSSAVNGHFSED